MNSAPSNELVPSTFLVDRRRHKRYRLAVPISVYPTGGPAIPAITLEISVGGLSAVLASPVQVGEKVVLENVATGKVSAQVCRQLGKVYGFQFVQLTKDQVNKIQDDCLRLPLYPNNRTGI